MFLIVVYYYNVLYSYCCAGSDRLGQPVISVSSSCPRKLKLGGGGRAVRQVALELDVIRLRNTG